MTDLARRHRWVVVLTRRARLLTSGHRVQSEHVAVGVGCQRDEAVFAEEAPIFGLLGFSITYRICAYRKSILSSLSVVLMMQSAAMAARSNIAALWELKNSSRRRVFIE